MIFRVAALGLGALAMYYFDPVSGNRRRALLRDKFMHYRHEAGDYAKGTLKHVRNRARGVAAEMRQADPDRTETEIEVPESIRHLGR
jgi:hypothetical protein